LLQPTHPRAVRSLNGARLYASAGVAAWAAVLANPDGARRQTQMSNLAANIPTAIQESRQEGTRAAHKHFTKTDIEKLGDQLSNLPLPAEGELQTASI
jgi:hypothetical protein